MFGSPVIGSSVDETRSLSSQSTRRTPKLSRPPVILGISQETVQTRQTIGQVTHGNNLPAGSSRNISKDHHYSQPVFNESRSAMAYSSAPISSSGFARRKAELPPAESLNQDGGQVVLG